MLAAALEAAPAARRSRRPPVPAPAERRAAAPPRDRCAARPLGPGGDPSDAVMRGARAILALRRAEALGVVSARAAAAGRSSSGRSSTAGSLPDRDRARPTTSIDRGDPGRRRCRSTSGSRSRRRSTWTAARSGTARSGSISGGSTRLMKQVGELVVAKNRLGVLAAAGDDPTLAEVSDRIARLVSGDAGRGDRRRG